MAVMAVPAMTTTPSRPRSAEPTLIYPAIPAEPECQDPNQISAEPILILQIKPEVPGSALK